MITLQNGDIFILNRKGKFGNFYSKAQRFFTKLPFTHAAIQFGEVKEFESIISADELVCLIPTQKYFDEEKFGTDIEIWRIKNANKNDIEFYLERLYECLAGTSYGYVQILWFIYRWFMESVFQKDVRHFNNPFKNGTVCSELTWKFLYNMSDKIPELRKKLNEWTPDTVSSGDIHNICLLLPNVFELVYKTNL